MDYVFIIRYYNNIRRHVSVLCEVYEQGECRLSLDENSFVTKASYFLERVIS